MFASHTTPIRHYPCIGRSPHRGPLNTTLRFDSISPCKHNITCNDIHAGGTVGPQRMESRRPHQEGASSSPQVLHPDVPYSCIVFACSGQRWKAPWRRLRGAWDIGVQSKAAEEVKLNILTRSETRMMVSIPRS